MFNLELVWKGFNISLDDVEANYRSNYPLPGGVDPKVDEPDHADLYYHGSSAGDNLILHFNKQPVGWNGYDEDGVIIAPDASSDGEAVWDFWNDIINTDSEATNYFVRSEANASMVKARDNAATLDMTTMSAVQKKLIVGAAISPADCRTLISEFP